MKRRLKPDAWIIVCSSLLLAGCGEDKPTEPDASRPATITDLRVDAVGETSVTLAWTAPGDDGDQGTAHQYDLRYSESSLTGGSWEGGTPISDPPMPRVAGTGQVVTVSELENGKKYYFALKAADEVPNWSGLSNVVSATVGRELITVAIQPSYAMVALGETQQFEALVTGTSNQRVAWTVVEGISYGSIDLSGLYTAPDNLPDSTTVTIRAASQEESDASATATVSLIGAVVVRVHPQAKTILTRENFQLTATVTGGTDLQDSTVTWVTRDEAVALVDADGLATGVGAGETWMVATANADPFESDSILVTVVGQAIYVPTELTLEEAGRIAARGDSIVVVGDILLAAPVEIAQSQTPLLITSDRSFRTIQAASGNPAIRVVDPRAGTSIRMLAFKGSAGSSVIEVSGSGELGISDCRFSGGSNQVSISGNGMSAVVAGTLFLDAESSAVHAFGGCALEVKNVTVIDPQEYGVLIQSSAIASVQNSIIVGSGIAGISCLESGNLGAASGCNDLWMNGSPYEDCIGGDLDFSLNPNFCDEGALDYTLQSISPCAPPNSGGCGLIGAYPAACDPPSP